MLILASASPRRQELLKLITKDFSVICSDTDERTIEESFDDPDIRNLPVMLAAAKARDVFDKAAMTDAVVIGADTSVICENRIMGKPSSKEEAREMLTFLSGKVHQVVTGVCIKTAKTEETFFEESLVRFHDLDAYQKELIERYISTDDPYDKAGAYGIQNGGALLVQSVSGDYFNIVGLPVAKLSRSLYPLI
ncbi:MAG: septum formation protein Maf [Clostridiales bacterium]|nr:septum formation protein Maf [Clostridiales bacterium]